MSGRRRRLRRGVRVVERVVGRRRLARALRLATDEVRRDGPNDLADNGEALVQRVALAGATGGPPVVVDVGCHHGEWSESLLAQPGPRPVLHAFEPSAPSHRRATAVLGDRATVHRTALSDRSGVAELQIVHEGAGSNSLVAFTDAGRTSGQTETVPTATLDELAPSLRLDHVTLLKIDAEGHDLAVLRGAAGLLTRQAIGMVQLEYNSRWIDARCFLLDAFTLLQEHGYHLGKVTPDGVETYAGWHPELETFRECNVLAWLPEWSERLPRLDWWGP